MMAAPIMGLFSAFQLISSASYGDCGKARAGQVKAVLLSQLKTGGNRDRVTKVGNPYRTVGHSSGSLREHAVVEFGELARKGMRCAAG
jgi:hypothetical protein